MKKTLFTSILLLSCNHALSECTPEKFGKEYQDFIAAQIQYRDNKDREISDFIEKIKVKNSLSDKQTFDFRISLLQNEKAKKIMKWEPKLTISDIFQLQMNNRCGKLMKYHKAFVKKAEKQWVIVLENAAIELGRTN